jgi:hypothetical protein
MFPYQTRQVKAKIRAGCGPQAGFKNGRNVENVLPPNFGV